MTGTPVRYEFGDFALDLAQQRLLRRATGEAIPLTGKAFDTLAFFVQHAGETLDKDVLLRSIWPGVIVEENSLTQNVSTLRQVLGETRGENRYIATIARKGYRFVAKVTRQDEEPVADAPRAGRPLPSDAPHLAKRGRVRLILAAATLFVAVATAVAWFLIPIRPHKSDRVGPTLAILPFKPLLPAERNESLELGMTESLISSLGQHSRHGISPLSSVRRFAALDQDTLTAGRALGVDDVLDGSLQRQGNRLRVSVRLLRVADGRQLWAQSFDQDFTEIFAVQDIIAGRVAQALAVGWVGSGSSRGAPYTADPEAYALYASGRFAWTRQTGPSLLQSIDFFEQAIAKDPSYALAYSGLADSFAVLGVFGIRAPDDVYPKARMAADKALSIDPNLAAAHDALGHVKVQYEHDWDGAAREYSLALRLDSSLALTYHRRGLLYAMQGDIDRATAASEQAQQLEPLWIAPRIAAANYLYYAKRYGESTKLIERVLAMDERSDNARGSLIRNLIAQGEYQRALTEIDKRAIQTPGSESFKAQALALSGRRGEALTELDRVRELSTKRYVSPYDIALIHAALLDTDNTFLWLERAVQDRSTLINFLAQDPMFDTLHSDPRFAALVQQVGIYHRVLPDAVTDSVGTSEL
jgi:DNA-binding winged helix-turn-helix (wHTH) protein/TolB-like protein/tetratricopeptide (TPR) repeat protein